MKSLWVYIREKNLQDPENRRKIICDDALRGLLGCESTDMFQMNKLLSKHIWPLVDAQRGKLWKSVYFANQCKFKQIEKKHHVFRWGRAQAEKGETR